MMNSCFSMPAGGGEAMPPLQTSGNSSGLHSHRTKVPPMHIVLFGAGHVGHALIALLGSLPCVVHWVDERDELFPD
jgi:xanthine dehydrogenase accessory factor